MSRYELQELELALKSSIEEEGSDDDDEDEDSEEEEIGDES